MAESDADATDGKLRGRVVLITGGRRVGGDLALMLAARGANVAMTYHTSRAVIEQQDRRGRGRRCAGAGHRGRSDAAGGGGKRRFASRRPLRPARRPREYGQRLSAHAAGHACRRRISTP